MDQTLAESFGLNKPTGALIAQVTDNSPADKGGLASGDIILDFNGNAVNYSSALPPLVGAVTPGKTVDVQVLRGGEEKTLQVTIEPLDEGERVASVEPADPVSESRMGVEVAKVTDEMKEQLGVSRDLSDLHPEIELGPEDEEDDEGDAAGKPAAAGGDDHDEL